MNATAPVDLTTTLQKVRVPSFVADRDGVVTWLNDAAKAEFGDLEGKPFTQIIPPERVDFVRRQLDRKLADPSSSTAPESAANRA